jgi:signal transduction histidine kinase
VTELNAALFGRRRHRALLIAGDVLTVLVCWGIGLTLIGIGLEDTPGLRSDVWIALDLLLGLVGVPLLFLRRRFPLLVAVLLVVFSSVSMGVAVASGVAVFALAVRRRWQLAVGVAAASVAFGTIQLIVWPDPAFSWWVGLLGQVLILTGILAWGMYARARRLLSATWREAAERSRAEQELRAEQARSVERARIAREMHDVLAHRISLVSMHAGALEVRLEGSADAEVVSSAATIRRSARAALEDLRDILGVLRAESDQGTSSPQPTVEDVPQLVAEVVALGMPVQVRIDVADVPEALGRTAYRVVQEGLTNVRKHAPGHTATVCVDGRRGRRVRVVVSNRPGDHEPVPLDAPSSGFGLVGLRERVELVGGTLRTRRVGEGFELVAKLPWPR